MAIFNLADMGWLVIFLIKSIGYRFSWRLPVWRWVGINRALTIEIHFSWVGSHEGGAKGLYTD